MKKKTLGLILALLMVFSLLPASAFAANVVQSGTCGDNLTWALDDAGVLTITGTGEMTDTPWRWYYTDSIKSVVIGDGVTSIYSGAFSDCSLLTDISIPNSVEIIGDSAFSNCSGLTEITIPNGITMISSRTFDGCSGLTRIDIPKSVTGFDYASFRGCSSLTKIDIPRGLSVLGSNAFEGCSGLTEITIPKNIEHLSSNLLSGCSGLKSIIIPDNIQEIYSSAFSGCTGLTSITIPESVTLIQPSTFAQCTGLKSVDIKGNVTSLQDSVFYGCSSLESVSFSNSVKSIGHNAFYGCNALKEIYFDGTDMQCAVINVEDGNDVLEDVTVYCSLDYPFTDIADSGYRDYISLGQALGIVNGYPNGTFRPRNTVTRAQYITMLYNMCGKPDVSGLTLNFKDTNTISGAYMDAVKWGVATGIVSGYGDNTFRPNQEITRAQMATFSYRLMKLVIGGEPDAELKADCGFKDSASIANVYKEAVNVMANLSIITGFDTDNDGKGDTFRPNATANRGQAATIIVRVAEYLGSGE